MIEVACDRIPEGWFVDVPMEYMVASICAGNTQARAYADDPVRPSVMVVHAHCNVYVAGQGTRDACMRAAVYLRDAVLTDRVRRQQGLASLFCGEDARWRACLQEAFAGERTRLVPRRTYRYEGPAAQPASREGILPITRDILFDESICNRSMILEEVEQMWGSAEAFLQSGFGTCTVLDGAVAGFCTAEYVSEGRCGIGIATAKAHRRKGYALAMTQDFLTACAARRITPYWECYTGNEGSVRTAEKAGLTRVCDYETLDILF